jgi:hypothetical protein
MRGSNHSGAQQVTRARQAEGVDRRRRHHRSGHPIAAAAPRTPRGLATALTSADAIEIAQGISITPEPGWTLGNRGPNWVALNDADTGAQMRVTVKPAGGIGVVAVLQSDVNQFTGTASAILGNVQNVSAPGIKALQSANFIDSIL